MRKVFYIIYFLLCAISIFSGDYITAIGLIVLGICCACIKKLLWLAIVVMAVYILWTAGIFTILMSLF